MKLPPILLGAAALAVGVPSHAAVLSLDTAATPFTVDAGADQFVVTGLQVNGAYFTKTSTILDYTAGTGSFTPFLRLQNNGSEDGYNSEAPLDPDVKGGTWTSDITFAELPTVLIGGNSYFSFFVDVNENNSAAGQKIIWEGLRAYVSSAPTIDGVGLPAAKYDLDAGGDNSIEYTDITQGSGKADIAFFLPVSNFGAFNPNDFFYMYQNWTTTDATFEETKTGIGIGLVPEPGSMAGLMGLLAGGAFLRSRRRPTA